MNLTKNTTLQYFMEEDSYDLTVEPLLMLDLCGTAVAGAEYSKLDEFRKSVLLYC
jgi:hypothetical protein